MDASLATANNLVKALRIALDAHKDQVDRLGHPYILHPIKVMTMVGDDRVLQIIALLHDVVEDSDWTLEELGSEGFCERVINGVDSMTRRHGETYTEFIERNKHNEDGRKVKIEDIRHNSSFERLSHLPVDVATRLAVKYAKALIILGR